MKATSLKWLRTYNLLIFDRVGSTNLEAAKIAKNNATGNFVVWAKEQLAGKGTRNRSWASEPGNLYMSILLQNDKTNLASAAQLSFLSSLAVYEGIKNLLKENEIEANIKLKWPNDILVNDKKIAGILLESTSSITSNNASHLIIGIGVNINSKPELVGKEAIALNDLGLTNLDDGVLLDRIMGSFIKLLENWQNEGFLNIRKSWLNKAYRINEIVTIISGKQRITGNFKDIDFNGNIRIKLASGQICCISAGDIYFDIDKLKKKKYL